jgi:hypothetical protein
MALRIDRPGRRHEYVLEADRESSKPTVFVLRPLTQIEMTEVHELSPLSLEQAFRINAIMARVKAENREATADETREINEIAPYDMARLHKQVLQNARTVRLGLEEIRELTDLDGSPLALSAAEFAQRAPTAVLRELAEEIVRLSRLGEDHIKK